MKEEIEELASNVVPGTPQWLRRKVLEFQYLDQLKLNDKLIPGYDSENISKRIVKQCSVKQELDRFVVVKVAKFDPDTNSLQPLGFPYPTDGSETPDKNQELSALKDYVDQIKFAGTSVRVITSYPDRIQVFGTVYFDGQYVESVVKENIINAIKGYLRNLPFDGVLLLSKLIDAVQAVEGVRDLSISIKTRESFVDPALAIPQPRMYSSAAGYIIPEDQDVNLSFNKTIEMALFV
jgi:hypothetical protein